MKRFVTIICCFLFSGLSLADENNEALYQIDLIVFTHQQNKTEQREVLTPPLLAPDIQHAIALDSQETAFKQPYQLLPRTSSRLKEESWALSQKPQYDILFNYSWLQPENNRKPIAIPQFTNNEWHVEGTIQTKHNSYYQLNTELLFTSPNNKQTAFLFSHAQRLKENTVYYFDHPNAGLLIKVHRVS